MTTVAPVDPQATVSAVYDESLDVSGAPVPAGRWRFYTEQWDKDGDPTGIEYGCPCGCGFLFNTPFETDGHAEKVWQWNGEIAAITVTPAIRIEQVNERFESVGAHWQGELVDGVFQANPA